MAHQYMPKIFHGLYKNPLPPSYILNVRSLNTLEDISSYDLPSFMPSDNAKGLILFAKHLFDQKKIRKYFNNDNKCEFPQKH